MSTFVKKLCGFFCFALLIGLTLTSSAYAEANPSNENSNDSGNAISAQTCEHTKTADGQAIKICRNADGLYYTQPDNSVIKSRAIDTPQDTLLTKSTSSPEPSSQQVEATSSLSDGNGTLAWISIFGVFCLGIFRWIVWNKKTREQAKQREQLIKQREQSIRRLRNLIGRHAKTLARKRIQLIFKDDYGNVFTANWEKEKNYFIENVLLDLIREDAALLQDMDVSLDYEIESLVDAAKVTTCSVDTVYSAAMLPIDYEKLCAQVLQDIGWEARLTRVTGDQGADVIAEKDGIRLVLQCKLYTQPVGNDAVQQAHAAKAHEQAQFAAVVSNFGYTKSAKTIGSTTGIALLHHDDLQEWAESISRNMSFRA